MVTSVVAWPVVKVYSDVAREMGFVRTIRDAANGGMSVDDIWNKFNSTGLYVLLLVAILKLISPSNLPLNLRGRNIRWLLMVVVVGVVMALGPVLKWQGKTVKIAGYPVPLPYAAAYYLVPGLQASRTISRWIWLAGFGMAGLIAIGFSRVIPSEVEGSLHFPSASSGSVGMTKWTGVLGCLIVAIVGGTHLVKYRELPSPEDFPKIYKWLKDQPGQVILELPRGGGMRRCKECITAGCTIRKW